MAGRVLAKFANSVRAGGETTLLLSLSAALSGCGGLGEGPNASETPIEGRAETLTRGTLLPAGIGAPDNAVVKLVSPTGKCSGIKIADRRYLTAHHCNFAAYLGQQISVTDSLDGGSGRAITLTRVHSHPTTFNIRSDTLRQDFQILEVAETNTIPTYSIYRKSRVGQGVTGSVTAYGCDLANPSNDGKKQYGFLTTGFDSRPGFDQTFIFVPQNTTNAALCPGDSGGPFFVKRNGTWEIAGINSGAVEIGRISSVYAWLQTPNYNNLVAGQKGFLLHKSWNRPLGMGSAHVAAIPVIQIWDARDHATGSDKQYWQLFAGSSTGSFVIKSTASGACLRANTNGSVSQVECTGSADTSWRFETPISGYYQVKNVSRNTCMHVHAAAGGTELRNVTCDFFTDDQRWLYSN